MDHNNYFFTKYQIPLFFLLTYILSWWTVPFLQGGIFPFGPALAAVIVLAGATGRQDLQGLWSRLTRWRVAWVWYAVGPAIMLIAQGIAFFLNILLGAQVIQFPQLPSAGAFLSILLFGGWWEEIGWSGYALPKLQERYKESPGRNILATLTLGIFRAIWHLPLFLYRTIFWFDILFFVIAFQLLISWVFNRSSGSVLVVMLLHLSSNFIGLVFYSVFTGTAHTNYYVLFMALESLIVIGIVWKSRLALAKLIMDPTSSSVTVPKEPETIL